MEGTFVGVGERLGGSRHVRIVCAVIFKNRGYRLARQDVTARRRIGGLSLPVQSFPGAWEIVC